MSAYLQNIQTNVPIFINIRMKAWRRELHYWWHIRIPAWKLKAKLVTEAVIHRVRPSINCCYPREKVVPIWKGRNSLVTRHLRNKLHKAE